MKWKKEFDEKFNNFGEERCGDVLLLNYDEDACPAVKDFIVKTIKLELAKQKKQIIYAVEEHRREIIKSDGIDYVGVETIDVIKKINSL